MWCIISLPEKCVVMYVLVRETQNVNLVCRKLRDAKPTIDVL